MMIEKSPEDTNSEPAVKPIASQENGAPADNSPASARLESGSSPESLRRTSSKIANLRAAFEKQQDANGDSLRPETPKRRFERSASGEHSQDEIVKLKDQVNAVTKLAERREEEIKKLKEQAEESTRVQKALEERVPTLEGRVKELEASLLERDEKCEAEVEKQNILSIEKSRLQDEASKTQQQLLELKRTIATNTRVENQVSDANIAEQMQLLYHEIQTWIVANYRKSERSPEDMCAKLESIAEPKLLALKAVFEKTTFVTRLSALQTVTVYYLVEIFQDPLFFGLPIQQRHLKKCAETLPTILSFEAFNRWRSVTADTIRQSESVRDSVESASRSMSEIICITLNTLTDSEESTSRIAALTVIVKKVISLAHICKAQRAQYDFDLPSAGSSFLSDSMEDTGGSDVAGNRSVRCATSPSVTKLGGEGGGDMHTSTLIAKAKVLCNE
ncbi:Hypothetical predicted protein [Lecanosticta acicola]|uniref:Uncharacterized protein n=1 Tax=Lecanosticta acicola TaxID=111012 RepID=A0AAI9EBF6_9PEZI|nr:Hypothetical predicted protein [Lecanosticta acicola]